jgi:hypothetical protein
MVPEHGKRLALGVVVDAGEMDKRGVTSNDWEGYPFHQIESLASPDDLSTLG